MNMIIIGSSATVVTKHANEDKVVLHKNMVCCETSSKIAPVGGVGSCSLEVQHSITTIDDDDVDKG